MFCGYCSPRRTIARGEPVLFVDVHGVRRRLVRCPHCAGEPVPDLPPLVETSPVPTGSDFTHVAASRPATRGALRDRVREWMPYRDDNDGEVS
jgi:hypothetical protein